MVACEYQARPVLTREEIAEKEGVFFDHRDGEDWAVFEDPEQDVVITALDTGALLGVVQRHAIPLDLCDTAVASYREVGEMVSTNRGSAAGMPHRKRRDGKSSYEKGTPANSSIMGFIDSTRFDRPCRLTAFSRDHFDQYVKGLPFIQAIDASFARAAPDAYQRQRAEALKCGENLHINGTAFSTVTVNLSFRTALHRDAGDFREGFGNIAVCSNGITGGHLLFPRYRVAVALFTGDHMALNVHEWHCNSPIEKHTSDGFRLSFVCYLRERMAKCAETNRRISLMQNGSMTVDDVCKRIFDTASEALPPRTPIGVGKNGIKWWALEGQRFVITYKNKRFTMYDKTNGHIVYNLLPALDYACHHGNE